MRIKKYTVRYCVRGTSEAISHTFCFRLFTPSMAGLNVYYTFALSQ